jgi:hypothetical protein
MRRNFADRLSALALGVCLTACANVGDSTEDGGFPEAPLDVRRSDSGALRIEVRTAPIQPPARGTSSVELRVTVDDEEPLESIDVAVLAWMPEMGHGSSTAPSVEDLGHGVYVLSNVGFYMPGTWELRSTFKGEFEDHAVLPVPVQ